MANFFDQFDQPETNFFDQFDQAPVQEAPKPDPEDDTLWNRFGANIAEGLHSTPLAIAIRTPKKPVYERDDKKRKEAEEKYEKEKQGYRAQRVAEIMQYDKVPDWTKEEDFTKRLTKLATTAAGQLAGGALDPFNLIPIGKGGTVLRTFLKGATPMAAYGAMAEHAMQTADIEMGVRQDYDWDAIKASAAMAGTISGGANVLGNHGSFTGKSDVPSPSVDNLKSKEAPSEVMGPPDLTPETQRPLPNFFDQFDTGPTLPERPAVDEPAMGYPHVEGVPPEPVPSRLNEPLPEITPELRPIETPEAPYVAPENDAPFPILQDYPQPFMDQLGPDVDPRNTMNNPYIQNAVDLETAQAHPDPGAHSEMKMAVEPQDPIFGPDATRAYDEGIPSDIENKRFAPNLAEQYPNTHLDLTEGSAERAGIKQKQEELTFLDRDPIFQRDAQARDDLAHVETVGEALAMAAKHGRKAGDRAIAESILAKNLDHNIPLRLDSTIDARGYTYTYKSGKREIVLHPDKADVSTILHETVHAHTNDALYAHEVGTANPAQRTYVRKLQSLYDLAAKDAKRRFGGKIPEYMQVWFKDLGEFNAYGLSDPLFQHYLSSVKTPEGSLFTKLLKALGEFFGIKREQSDVFHDLLRLTNDWENIQSDLGTRGTNIRSLKAQRAIKYEETPLTDVNPDLPAGQVADLNNNLDLDSVDAAFKSFVTPNQIKHRVVKWFMGKMGQIYRQSAPRFHDYHEALKPFMFSPGNNLSRQDQIGTFKVLIDIQSPKLRDARALAEASNKREDFLREHGLVGRQVDFAITVLDIMKDIHTKDTASLQKLGRDHALGNEPMYFPRMHGGKFIVKVLDQNGVEQYVRGFDNYKDARADEAKLRNGLVDRPDMQVQKVQRAEDNKFGDDLSMLLLEQKVSFEGGKVSFDFLTKGMKSIEKTRETAPFSFEKHRRDTDVGGYIGEEILTKADEEAVLKAMSWRLQASRNLETKARILSEIKFPLFDTMRLAETPKLAALIGNLINRELGVDIGKNKFDDALQGGFEAAANLYGAIDHFTAKYIRGRDTFDFRWEDPKVGHAAVKDLFRKWTYLASQYYLGLNVPVLATNFAQPLILSADGVRTAKLEGLNDGYAMTAQMKMMAYLGQPGPARDFMLEARREGMIEPHGQEHYTTAELPDRARWDRIIQYPRDRIEESTNYASILYYYHFFTEARPDLKGEALKSKVYEYARSFTGQYESFAGPLMFDQAGTMGQLFTNFSKWHFNQLGRFVNDIKMAKNEHIFFPLIMTFMQAGLIAGFYGLPIVVEYEAIRRLGSELGIWDLPPVSGIEQVVGDVPAWQLFDRGLLTAGGDALAKSLGGASGPDISGSMRFAAFFDTPLVAVQFFWKMMSSLIPTGLKEAKLKLGGAGGASPAELEKAFNALPPAAKGGMKALRDYTSPSPMFKAKVKMPDGNTLSRVLDPSESGRGMYTLSDVEDVYNLFGLKSEREVKHLESIYYDKWLKRQDKKDLETYTQGILSHIGDEDVFRRNIRSMLEIDEGQAAIKNVMNQIKTRVTASKFDYFTEELRRLQKQRDGMKAAKQMKRIEKARKLAPTE